MKLTFFAKVSDVRSDAATKKEVVVDARCAVLASKIVTPVSYATQNVNNCAKTMTSSLSYK